MSMIFRYDIGLHCTSIVPTYTFTIHLYVAFAVSARVLDILCIQREVETYMHAQINGLVCMNECEFASSIINIYLCLMPFYPVPSRTPRLHMCPHDSVPHYILFGLRIVNLRSDEYL